MWRSSFHSLAQARRASKFSLDCFPLFFFFCTPQQALPLGKAPTTLRPVSRPSKHLNNRASSNSNLVYSFCSLPNTQQRTSTLTAPHLSRAQQQAQSAALSPCLKTNTLTSLCINEHAAPCVLKHSKYTGTSHISCFVAKTPNTARRQVVLTKQTGVRPLNSRCSAK